MIGRILRNRSRLAVGSGVVAPLVVAALLVPFRGTFASTAAALVLVIVIVAVAVIGNRLAGVVASASAALWFDFFLTRPYDRFAISHRPDLETTIAIFVVGVLVTEVAERSRQHWQSANSSTAYVAMIHGVAVLAADSAPVASMIEQDESSRSFNCSRCERVVSTRPSLIRRWPRSSPTATSRSSACGGRFVRLDCRVPKPRSSRSGGAGWSVDSSSPRRPVSPVSLEQRIVAVAVADVFAAYLVGEMRES